ncbi:unannotated protein [freshwater metagenome]|uniref:Unannotated protein n=1 Tax=freshwater metagenome TaxID=449393 RepID=A0A6J6Y455_9ZZZZ
MVAQDVDHRDLVEEIAGNEFDIVLQMTDAFEIQRRAPANHANDVVTLVEEQFGEIGAVLAGDSSDECSFGHCGIPLGDGGFARGQEIVRL